MPDTNKTKEDMVEILVRKIMRITNKRNRIEARPIYYEKDAWVTTKEIHTIQAIGEHKEINVTELANYSGVTKSAVSQLIKKLEKKGLVDKRHSDYSKKELVISLTKIGWKAFDAHEAFHGEHMTYLMDQLNTFRLPQIAQALVLLDHFENTMDRALSQLTPPA